ncbi:MAG TPA: hypothetical protein VID73_12110, partial [Ktedonobacterales bacterium]
TPAASTEPPPPVWPLAPDYQPEPSYPTAAADLGVAPALRHESDLTPYPTAAPDPAATHAEPYAGPAVEPPATPAHEAPTVPWGEWAAGGLAAAAAGGMAAAILGPHDSQSAAMPLGEPGEAAPAASPATTPTLAAGDPTDQAAHLAEHRALADVGEPLSEPVRVALPDAGAADAATATLIFQHEDTPSAWPSEPESPAHETSWGTLAGTAGVGAAAAALGAYELHERHDPAPAAEPPAAEPAPITEMPAALPAEPAMVAPATAAPEHRTVKRVRVVRRLMVDGKVVQETAAEEVVDAGADTTAAAARLREALGATDPDTLASLAHQSVEGEHTE